MSAASGGVLIYVQHLLGIGHQRRAAAIARGLRRAGVPVTYVSGGYAVSHLDIGGADFIQLPAARAADAAYNQLLDAGGQPVNANWRDGRRRALLDAFTASRARLVLLETFPFGRRMFRFELLPLLRAARASSPRARVAVSVRDIIEPKRKPGREDETVAWVDAYIDRVLVHGDPRIATLDYSFAGAGRLAGKIHYTGYVLTPRPASAAGHAEVLVSVGGGAVGARLLAKVASARELTVCASRNWRFLIGAGGQPALRAEIARLAGPGASIEANREDFAGMLTNAFLSVSQAGYNTVVETVSAPCRCVLAPFAEHDEQEQTLRARAFASAGLVSWAPGHSIDTQTMADAINRAAGAPPPARDSIAVDGVSATVASLNELLEASS